MIVGSPTLCSLGSHRVIDPPGALPQNARVLDNTPVARANEILCEVEALNIDAASFRQISDACGSDGRAIGEHILATVAEFGKQHNPVTGSGGMFIGRIAQIGEELRERERAQLGDRVASLVSLTLTPLHLDEVVAVDVATGRVRVRGHAILFASGHFTKLPDDIPADVALSVLDVAGAPAQVRRLSRPGHTVAVIGADGKSGMLTCAAAKMRVGKTGRVVGIAPDAGTPSAKLLLECGLVDEFVALDARKPLDMLAAIPTALPHLADVVVNCVNVQGTELSSILCAREDGTVYFFSMCTSFTAAALGAEGIGKDVTMIVGNGYAKGHVETALQTLRSQPKLLAHFTDRYARK